MRTINKPPRNRFRGGAILEVTVLYIYPDNLTAKATLWLWTLRDLCIMGAGLLISVLVLSQTGMFVPLVLSVVYGFLTIRLEEVSILDFLTYAVAFFLTQQQYYEWRLDDAA